MVKKSILDQFVKLGGYNIVRHRSDKWKNISEASKRTGISRPTIYTILKKYPEEPSKVMPKYVEEFKESEGYRILKETYGKRKFWFSLKNVILEGFAFLKLEYGYGKDPISWNEKDFRKIWEKWHDPKLETIASHKGVQYRRLITLLAESSKLEKKFKTIQVEPEKAHWYLEEPDITAIINVIERADFLILFLFGIFTGSRISAILTLIPEKIKWLKWKAIVYEKKIKKEVPKYLNESFTRLMERYVKDFQIQPTERLFPMSDDAYNRYFKRARKGTKITIKTTTHIMKHTFVQQSHEHGVPAEVVVQQTHTELRTLKKWYSFVKEEKIQKHMQGKKWDPEPFTDFMDRIVAHATRRYEQIR